MPTKLSLEDKEINKLIEELRGEKLDNNISRAKSKIFEYALCNEFDYFITLTLDKSKYDRYNLDKFIKDLGQVIRNRRKKGEDIQYLLIPEKHKNGAWHLHGLIKGIKDSSLKIFTLDDNIPKHMKKLIKKGRKLYNWTSYYHRFGFCSLEKIHNNIHCAKYITKYITKDIKRNQTELNKKLYYNSRGLKKSTKIIDGEIPTHCLEYLEFNYENDYLKILDISENNLDILDKLCYSLNIENIGRGEEKNEISS